MATAKQLPSGAWRAQACKTINKKVIRKSFTVHPDECGGSSRQARIQSETLAREWILDQKTSEINGPTIKEAFESYIQDRSKVLSPSTIRGYKLILEAFNPMWDIYISDIETPQIQRLVNDWAMDMKSKTIKNRVSLLLAVLDYSGVEKRFKIRYPQNNSKKVLSPDIQDVQYLLDNAKGIMQPIIYLAAFGTLRRGEIAGLRECDISRDMRTITVKGDLVLGPDGWFYKPFPKTEDSTRTVELPKFIIDAIPVKDDPKDFVFDLTPTAMTDRFKRLADKLQLPYTLHSLRHFSASFRSDIGIPKKYVQEAGGWVTDSTIMDRVYDNTLESSRRYWTKLANKFIEDNFKPKEATE